jgi:hypothetical protein
MTRAAPTPPVPLAVRPQPSKDDSRRLEPVQARSRFASLPTGAELLPVGVVAQLLPIPSYSILQALLIAALAAVYHALYAKTAIPFIGILYNNAAKLGHLAAFIVAGRDGCSLSGVPLACQLIFFRRNPRQPIDGDKVAHLVMTAPMTSKPSSICRRITSSFPS